MLSAGAAQPSHAAWFAASRNTSGKGLSPPQTSPEVTSQSPAAALQGQGRRAVARWRGGTHAADVLSPSQ